MTGCFNGTSISANTSSIFECLASKDTGILQYASAVVSASGLSGTWGFLPVTDGKLIQQLPSQQLLKQQVNGLRILSGVSPTPMLAEQFNNAVVSRSRLLTDVYS